MCISALLCVNDIRISICFLFLFLYCVSVHIVIIIKLVLCNFMWTNLHPVEQIILHRTVYIPRHSKFIISYLHNLSKIRLNVTLPFCTDFQVEYFQDILLPKFCMHFTSLSVHFQLIRASGFRYHSNAGCRVQNSQQSSCLRSILNCVLFPNRFVFKHLQFMPLPQSNQTTFHTHRKQRSVLYTE